MKNDFNEEYKIDLSTVKYVAEKGFFHIFGEFFTSELSFIRNDSPDKTECTLSLGEKAGQSLCPEQESFLYRWNGDIIKTTANSLRIEIIQANFISSGKVKKFIRNLFE